MFSIHKKSKWRIDTPIQDMGLISTRLRDEGYEPLTAFFDGAAKPGQHA